MVAALASPFNAGRSEERHKKAALFSVSRAPCLSHVAAVVVVVVEGIAPTTMGVKP